MAKVSFYKLTNTDAAALPIREGQVIFVTDTKRLFLDNANNSRIEMTSYNLIQDASDNHILTFIRPDGTSSSYTIPDHIYTGENHIIIDENNVISLDEETTEFFDGETIIEKNSENLVHLEDVYIPNINELKLSKESSQKTTTGKQLLNVDLTFPQEGGGITLTKDDDGKINLNGTVTSQASLFITSQTSITLEPGTYTLSRPEHFSCYLIPGYKAGTFTLDETTIFTQAYIPVQSHHIGNTYNESFYPMLVSGNTLGDYESYTGGQPSPNPSYPQEVKTVKGYRNLFDKDSSNYFNTYIGSVSHAISTAESEKYRTIYIPIEGGKKYTITKKYGGSLALGTSIELPYKGLALNDYAAPSNRLKYTINTSSSANYLIVYIYSNVDYENNLPMDDVMNTLLITEGTEEKPYVPYGTNWIYTKVIGKNEFDGEIELGSLNATGVPISTNNSVRTKNFQRVKPNTAYKISNDKGYQANVKFYDINKNYLSNAPGNTGTFTTTNDTYFVKWRSSELNVENDVTVKYQLEQGTQATSYEPYKENIVILPLNGNEIAGKGDYKDEYIIDSDGHCWLRKKFGKYVYNNDLSPNGLFENYTAFITPVLNVGSSITQAVFANMSLCNMLPVDMTNYTGLNGTTASKKIRINLSINIATSYNEGYALFLDKNLTIYYVLETPELIDLNYDVDIRLFKGVNNISNSENADMILLYYNKSIDGLYNNLSDRIDSINYIDKNEKGNPGGVGELDENGILLTSQMPSYVDDVLEYNNQAAFPTTGESGKIYVALDTNKTYRWSGTTYTEISPSLALGETSSTAYRGDRGAAAYKHAVTNKGVAASSNLYKITTNSEGHVTNATAVVKSDIVNLGIPGSADQGIKIENNVIKLEDEPYHLLYDDAETKTEENTNLYIEDALEGKIKELTLNKESTQETTTGKNYANFGNDTITKTGVTLISSGSELTLNGTATAETIFNFDLLRNYINDNLNNKNINISCIKDGTVNGRIILWLSKEGTWFWKNMDLSDNNNISISSLPTIETVRIVVNNNTTLTNLKLKIQIEEGSTATSYEEYTGGQASPNPEFPQEVKTVKGYRNLFDKTLTSIVNNRLKTEILSTGIRVICNVRDTDLQANNAVRYVTIDVTDYIGKKITLFCHAKSSSINKGFFYLRLCKQNGDTDSNYGTQTSAATLDGDLSVTYEIPSGIGEYHYLMIAIYGNRNSPCEINDYVDYTNLMLVEGENKYPYVSYGTDYVYTKVTGKNLIGFDDEAYTSQGINWTVVKNAITMNGTAIGNWTNAINIKVDKKFALEPGTYVLSTNHVDNFVKIYKYIYEDINGQTQTINFAVERNQSKGVPLTIPEDAKFQRCVINIIGITSGTSYNTSFSLMLEKNDIATEFEPYKESIVTIPLNDNKIVGIGDYKDELIVDKNGHCWLNKKTNKIILDGSENWAKGSKQTRNRYYVNNLINTIWNNDRIDIISNYFVCITPNQSDGDYIGLSKFNAAGFMINFDLNDENFDTIEKFKTWLSTHNTEVYYVLATPQLIDLNYTVNMTLFKDINNISNSEDANMSVTYLNDSINGKYQQFIDITGLIGNDLDIINGEEV